MRPLDSQMRPLYCTLVLLDSHMGPLDDHLGSLDGILGPLDGHLGPLDGNLGERERRGRQGNGERGMAAVGFNFAIQKKKEYTARETPEKHLGK